MSVCLFPPPRTNSLVFFLSIFSQRNWNSKSVTKFGGSTGKQNSSLRSPMRAMSSADLIRARIKLQQETSFVQAEKKIGKSTHPWGTPLFSVSSSENTGSQHKRSFKLTHWPIAQKMSNLQKKVRIMHKVQQLLNDNMGRNGIES